MGSSSPSKVKPPPSVHGNRHRLVLGRVIQLRRGVHLWKRSPSRHVRSNGMSPGWIYSHDWLMFYRKFVHNDFPFQQKQVIFFEFHPAVIFGGVAMRFGMYLFLTGNKFTNGTCSCHCCQIEARQSFFPLFLRHWLTSVFLPQVILKYYKTICFNQSLTYFQQLQPVQTHVRKVFSILPFLLLS